MTAISAPRASVRTTRFERTLLSAAAGLDHFVSVRLERRAATPRPHCAQGIASDARTDALSTGSIGMLPR
jgi:hypothetical protein